MQTHCKHFISLGTDPLLYLNSQSKWTGRVVCECETGTAGGCSRMAGFTLKASAKTNICIVAWKKQRCSISRVCKEFLNVQGCLETSIVDKTNQFNKTVSTVLAQIYGEI